MINTRDEADDLAGRLPCLHEFAAAGQDKAAVARLYNALLEDLAPDNLIERIWLRDIAVLTIRSEELRMVQLAVHNVVMSRAPVEPGALPASGPAKDVREEHVPGTAQGFADGPGGAHSTRPGSNPHAARLVEHTVGLTYAENLSVISQLAEMESDVRKDRDRILEAFGQRRRRALQDMADALADVLKGRS